MVSIVSVNHHGKEGFLNGKGPEIFKMTHFFHSSPRKKPYNSKKMFLSIQNILKMLFQKA